LIITAIKYRTKGSNEPEVFRFTAGTAGLRHAICFQSAGPEGVAKAQAALALVLNGTASGLVSDAAIQIADSAGDTWVLTRGSQGFSVSRNGESLSSEQVRKSLISALLDIDLAMGSGGAGTGVYADGDPIAAMLEISRGNGGRLVITPAGDDGHARTKGQETQSTEDKFRGFVDDAIKSATSQIATFLGASIVPRIHAHEGLLPDLVRKVEPLVREARDLEMQVKEVENPDTFSREDQKRLDALLPEIELIDRIKALAMPLLDPADGISAIQDRLRAIDHELSLRLSSSGSQTLPELAHPALNREWRKALRPLAQYQAAKALLEQWRSLLDGTRDELDPLIAEHLHSVEESIRRDAELSGELESSIQFLRLKLTPVPSSIAAFQAPSAAEPRYAAHGGVQRTVNTWFDKLKDSIQGSQPAPQAAIPQQRTTEFPPRQYIEMLEATEVAVTCTNKRLDVMQSHVEAIRSDIDAQRDSFMSSMKRMDEQCQEANRNWLEVAREAGLGPEASDFQVDQLVDLLLNRFELLKLQEEKEELRSKLQDRLARFDALERLITEWRQMTDSQKALDLSHPGIIISEARAIIRYRDEKNKVAERLRQLKEKSKSTFSKLSRLDERALRLNRDWQATLQEYRLPAVSAGDPRWPEILDAARRITTLGRLLAEFATECAAAAQNRSHTSLQENAAREAAGKPVLVYVWRVERSTELDREEFMRFTREQSSGALLVVLTADPLLAADLYHHGSGRAIEIRPQARIAAQPPQLQDPSAGTLLNPRARQALAALTNPRK
jgi:hypothetical protein